MVLGWFLLPVGSYPHAYAGPGQVACSASLRLFWSRNLRDCHRLRRLLGSIVGFVVFAVLILPDLLASSSWCLRSSRWLGRFGALLTI
jgi:hypothetical protein